MKLILLVLSFGIFTPQGGQTPVPASDCGCAATWSAQPPSELDCCTGAGTPPIIVPSNQSATNGDCAKVGQTCKAIADSQCTGSVDVQVTFPAGGSSCSSVWVMGGSTYPVPTKINSGSQTVTLTVAADCKATSSDTDSATFKVWCARPMSGGQAADAEYTFNLNCGSCDTTSTQAEPPQPF